MRGGLAEVPAAECRRTEGSRHSAVGGQAGGSGGGKPPAPDECKAEHIQAETVTRGFAGRHEEGTRHKKLIPEFICLACTFLGAYERDLGFGIWELGFGS